MIEPNYDKILKDKIDYYGETKAAYEFAAYEYNKLNKWKKLIEMGNTTQKKVRVINLT